MDSHVAIELTQRVNRPWHRCLRSEMASKDAKDGADPYLRRSLGSKTERREAVSSAWGSLAKILFTAIVLDSALQHVTESNIQFVQAIGVASLLCILPYSVKLGPAARFACRDLK